MTQVQTLLLAVASAALACLVSPSTGSTFAAPERLATSISQASDSLGSCSRSSCLLDLEGPITQRTYLAIAELIGRRSPNQVVEIHLNSLGGDLEAAVRIGRLLRSNAPVRATVLPSAVCASACVFALVGATTRLIGGSVAVHRPYTVDSRSRSHSDLQRLTGRSTGAPTAGHQARAAPWFIMHRAGKASIRRRPVNSALGRSMNHSDPASSFGSSASRCASGKDCRSSTPGVPGFGSAWHAKQASPQGRFAPPCCAGQSAWPVPSQAQRSRA
jgi:hypothetical protein